MTAFSAVRARAVVRLEIELDLHQAWGGEFSAETIHKQASREATERVTRWVEGSGARVVGVIRVVQVLAEAKP